MKSVSQCILILGLTVVTLLVGCGTPAQSIALGIGVAASVGGRTPSQELEQIYYVGVFDPDEQLPPTVYRLTVRGQASVLSGTKFASGWVPAGLVDSLNGRVDLDPLGAGEVEFSQTNHEQNVNLNTGRRLMMFGPEGFREAPRDHRLVIVMGANPKGFFEAVDGALGEISGVALERRNTEIGQELHRMWVTTASSRDNLGRFRSELAEDMARHLDQ